MKVSLKVDIECVGWEKKDEQESKFNDSSNQTLLSGCREIKKCFKGFELGNYLFKSIIIKVSKEKRRGLPVHLVKEITNWRHEDAKKGYNIKMRNALTSGRSPFQSSSQNSLFRSIILKVSEEKWRGLLVCLAKEIKNGDAMVLRKAVMYRRGKRLARGRSPSQSFSKNKEQEQSLIFNWIRDGKHHKAAICLPGALVSGGASSYRIPAISMISVLALYHHVS